MLFPLRSFPSPIPKARQRSRINFRWFARSGSEIPGRKGERQPVIRPQLSTCANCQPLPELFVYIQHLTSHMRGKARRSAAHQRACLGSTPALPDLTVIRGLALSPTPPPQPLPRPPHFPEKWCESP